MVSKGKQRSKDNCSTNDIDPENRRHSFALLVILSLLLLIHPLLIVFGEQSQLEVLVVAGDVQIKDDTALGLEAEAEPELALDHTPVNITKPRENLTLTENRSSIETPKMEGGSGRTSVVLKSSFSSSSAIVCTPGFCSNRHISSPMNSQRLNEQNMLGSMRY